ncbi:hypothetical protein COL922a_010168 [Colletotrichum nupharicola]|nr:hypothetical protein COL922a_010168 [Colletotrichum nupharicola]
MSPKAATMTASRPRKPRKPLRIPTLPPDVHRQILSFASQSTLLSARLVNKNFSFIATPLAFRYLYLGSKWDCDRLVCVSKSPKLSGFVEEIDLVGWIEEAEWWKHHYPWRMLAILPYVRSFRNLKSLYLGMAGFNFKWQVASLFGGPFATRELRSALLDTLFACIAGEWTQEEHAGLLAFIIAQKKPEDDKMYVQWIPPDAEPARPDVIDFDEDMCAIMLQEEFGKKKKKPKPWNCPPDAKLLQDPLWQSWETLLGPALPLETLSIGGLAQSDDLDVIRSSAFKKMASLKSLTALKFSVSHKTDSYAKSVTRMYRSDSPMLHSLPNTLLCPAIADNLKVLSLYGPNNFGWHPSLDFRRINCKGKSPLMAGLPSLRVLALGGFSFTQTWQADWIASLGKGYGGSGLKELYLDDCHVLTEARKFRLQSGQTTIGRDSSGQAIKIDNSDFPDAESIVNGIGSDRVRFDLRWHHILDSWRQSMTALQVFVMGCGDHGDNCLRSVVEANYPDQLPIMSDHNCDPRFFRHGEKAFLNYKAPPPPFDHEEPLGDRYYKKRNRPEAPQYKYGVGMTVNWDSECSWRNNGPILRYTKFDGGMDYYPWTESYDDERPDFRHQGMKTDEPDTVKEDMKSYELLIATVKTRAAS